MFDEINTLDTTTIIIGKNTLKARTGKWVVYDYDWLLEHIEQEMNVLLDVKAYKQQRMLAALKKLRGEKE